MPSVPEESAPTDASSDDDAAVTDLLRRLDEGAGAQAAAPAEADAAQLMSRLDGILGRRGPSPVTPADQVSPGASLAAPDVAPKRRSPSALADFGTDLTARAKESSPSFLGRDAEIDTVLEALCRRRKANPLLLGPPGSGKTALVEALAARIASGTVPPVLKDQRVIAVNTGALVAGAGMVGEIEARVDVLLKEASAPDVILFFDEVHALMGAGGREGSGDVASLLKPALARGEIRCIAATTDDEYHRFIRTDSALERRFLPVRLRALTAQETRGILALLRDQDPTGPTIPDRLLDSIVDIADRMLPNRHFPDKAIDLFDQVMAFARLREAAVITDEIVDEVAERIAGVPASPTVRLERLSQALREGGWCSDDDIDAITERLSITLRGLDLNMERPNLVAEVTSPTVERLRSFAGLIAASLYGDERRVIDIDGSALGSEAAMTTLLGAIAGYVGYGDRHLLAPLIDQPCHVVVVRSIGEAHPSLAQLLDQAIDSGWITDQQRRRIPFSECVLLQWSEEEVEGARAVVGFASSTRRAPMPRNAGGNADVRIVLGAASQVHSVLEQVAIRWREQQGIVLEWTPATVAWVNAHTHDESVAARWVDQHVSLPLWRLLQGPENATYRRVRVDVRDGQLVIEPLDSGAPG